MNMNTSTPSDSTKAYLVDTLSALTADQLRNIILTLSGEYGDHVVMVALDEKRKKPVQATSDQTLPPIASSSSTMPTFTPAPTQKSEIVSIRGSSEESEPVVPSKRKTTDGNTSINKRPATKICIQANLGKLKVLGDGCNNIQKARLFRLAATMDLVDWDSVNDRSDIYERLWTAEQEYSADSGEEFDTTFGNKHTLRNFVRRHHERLGSYNPAFLIPYNANPRPVFINSSIKSTQTPQEVIPPPSTRPPRPSTHLRPSPPLDWGSISAELALVDVLDIDNYMDGIVKDFGDAFKKIHKTCSMMDRNDFKLLGQQSKEMARLAKNMAEARPRHLRSRLLADRSYVKLHQCMMFICHTILEQEKAIMGIDKDAIAWQTNLRDVFTVLQIKDNGAVLIDLYSAVLRHMSDVQTSR